MTAILILSSLTCVRANVFLKYHGGLRRDYIGQTEFFYFSLCREAAERGGKGREEKGLEIAFKVNMGVGVGVEECSCEAHRHIYSTHKCHSHQVLWYECN